MIATAKIYLIRSSENVRSSPTLSFAGKIQERSRCSDTACRRPAHDKCHQDQGPHRLRALYLDTSLSTVTTDQTLFRYWSRCTDNNEGTSRDCSLRAFDPPNDYQHHRTATGRPGRISPHNLPSKRRTRTRAIAWSLLTDCLE
jgi:hypothetical protein